MTTTPRLYRAKPDNYSYNDNPWFWNWHISEWVIEQIRKEPKQ